MTKDKILIAVFVSVVALAALAADVVIGVMGVQTQGWSESGAGNWVLKFTTPSAGGDYALGSTGATTNNVILTGEPLYDFVYNQDFSISCWVKTTTTAGWVPIICKTDNDVTRSAGWGLEYHGGAGVKWIGFWISGTGSMIDVGQKDLGDGNWHHIVGVYRGTEGQAQTNSSIYCDGVVLAKVKGGGPITGSGLNNYPVKFFSDDGENAGFAGVVDEVVIYSKALTATEVGQAYNATNRYFNAASQPYDSGVICAYHLDENTGWVTSDSVTTNTGILQGTTWEAGYVEAP